MGGYGSGRRRFDKKTLVEELRSIDVRRWKRDGHLIPGRTFVWNWYSARDGSVGASIDVSVDRQSVALEYRVRQEDSPWSSARQIIPLSKTPCNLGGERHWFLCPDCERRVCLLYIDSQFSCRECLYLSYASQRQLEWERNFEKARSIHAVLGWNGDLFDPIKTKPQGMHWKKYHRLCEEFEESKLNALRGAIHGRC